MEFTLDRPAAFPVGTSVNLYFAEAVVDEATHPAGDPLDTQIVGFVEEVEDEETEEMKVVLDEASTAVVFKGLEARRYAAGAEVDGEWRFRFFQATAS